MRKFILSALLLTVATPVLAQVATPSERREFREDRREFREDLRDDRQDNRQDFREDRRDDRQEDRRDFRDDRREFRDDRRDDREDRRDDRRDFRDDRRDYRQSERFGRYRGNAYVYPSGYGYRYYSPGVRVPRAYFTERYYIGRPDFYRLPPALRGTRWIRIGSDALLIRRYDGTVVRSIRGLFY